MFSAAKHQVIQFFVYMPLNEIWAEVWVYLNSWSKANNFAEGPRPQENKTGTYMTKNPREELCEQTSQNE